MKKVEFLAGVVVGSAIGGAIALLFAPKTGAETRQIIKDKSVEFSHDVKDVAVDLYQDSKMKSLEGLEHLKNKVKNFPEIDLNFEEGYSRQP